MTESSQVIRDLETELGRLALVEVDNEYLARENARLRAELAEASHWVPVEGTVIINLGQDALAVFRDGASELFGQLRLCCLFTEGEREKPAL
jgi:hypothetical protein